MVLILDGGGGVLGWGGEVSGGGGGWGGEGVIGGEFGCDWWGGRRGREHRSDAELYFRLY